MNALDVLEALQRGDDASEIEIEEAERVSPVSERTSPITRLRKANPQVPREHPSCCGQLMVSGERDHTLLCKKCTQVVEEDSPIRSHRRTSEETRRAALNEELLRYNHKYREKFKREIPQKYLREAVELFLQVRKLTKIRDTPGGDLRCSILASCLLQVCKGWTNFGDNEIREFFATGGVKAVITFSSGDRKLRDLCNRGLLDIDLNVNPAPAMLRGNLQLLGLSAPEGRVPTVDTGGADMEGAALRILELSTSLYIEPGVQPQTRTLGIVWFLLVRLHARQLATDLNLRTIKDKCKIGDTTITNFQRKLEKHLDSLEGTLREYGVLKDE